MSESLDVLLIVLGGVRPDRMSAYGAERETTPTLKQVAREGVRFTNAFTSSPSRLSALASIFTGLHAHFHGATPEHPRLAGRATLAEILREAGYRTAAFCTDGSLGPQTGLAAGFDAYFTQRRDPALANRALWFGRRTADRFLRRTDGGARRTGRAVQKWAGASDRPSFAFVHVQETRVPVVAPPPFERMFLGSTAEMERAQALQRGEERPASERDTGLVRALHDGALRYVDQMLGELFDGVRRAGRWDRTLLIVTSDGGQSLGEDGRIGDTGGLSDALLRIPLLLRCPARLPAGFVVEELTQNTDLLPTILDLVGAHSDRTSLSGRPLLRDGGVTPGPEFIVAERFRTDPPTSGLADMTPVGERSKCLRTHREKYVWCSAEANELYDLVSDPGEHRNRIVEETPRADALRRKLFRWLSQRPLVEPVRGGEARQVVLESTA